MLDVAWHFFPADDIRQLLDVMCWHKLNRFHWHLTDDEGWRVESTALPGLMDHDEGRPLFYSRDEVRLLVAHDCVSGLASSLASIPTLAIS